ncbi:MAG: SDR family NAD(P)-dependent oxidoreductase, partial [Solirubrobacterales bacterium]|nr:SDR family NAD(P)-dependent oxidoreductase [Solirubrobacterales bacterium]
ALAGAGANLVLAVRDLERGRRAAADIGGRAEARELDLANLASVRTFAETWDGPIDVLINNAGISSPKLRRTLDSFELQFGTNHLGHFALTNLLLEHVTDRVVTLGSQAERAGRIDFDDPNFARRAYSASTAYNQSKLANLLFSSELQRRLRQAGSPVLAEAAHPGLVTTNIYAESGALAQRFVRRLGQTPEAGALPVLYAAVAKVPGDSFAGPSRMMHMRGAPELIKRSKRASDPELASRLWTVSEQLTATHFSLVHTIPAG